METQEIIQRITKFISVCSAAVTVREVCGGTGLSFDTVRELLPLLAQNGILRIVEGADNLAQYTMPSGVPMLEPPKAPYVSAEAMWNAEARAAGLARYRREHPEETVAPSKAFEPTDADVQAIIDAEASKKREPLTAEEQKWLEYTRTLKPANPQEFLKH
jgi:hypothetical protein